MPDKKRTTPKKSTRSSAAEGNAAPVPRVRRAVKAATNGQPRATTRRRAAAGPADALDSMERKGAPMKKGKLKIAMIAAEMFPLAKVGGLADVLGSLSEVLSEAGHRVVVILPHYRGIKHPAGFKEGNPVKFPVLMPDGTETAVLTPVSWRGLESQVYLLGGGDYFDRDGIYTDPATGKDFEDNPRRFVFFQKAVLEGLKAIEYRPDILHLNDYQTGLIPSYLKLWYAEDSYYKTCATVYSIHNLGYQGVYPPETAELAGIPWKLFYPMSPFEFYGRFNFMKAGVTYADMVTTVSERYAREITESNEFGFGLEGVLRGLGPRLKGILNGIDTSVWSPQSDRHIPQNFGPQNLHLKKRNKEALLDKMKLPTERMQSPLIGIISRLAAQKGFDLIEGAANALLSQDVSLVVLGDGDERYRRLFTTLHERFPHKVAFEFGFNDPLAHLIEAGSDMFLMPSRYEPCGLNQMYSMRYGTVPIVRATGGLADTVKNWDPVHRDGTGFSFDPYTSDALYDAVRRALELWREPDTWKGIMLRCMSQDFSWAASAEKYAEAYEEALDVRRKQTFASWLTTVG